MSRLVSNRRGLSRVDLTVIAWVLVCAFLGLKAGQGIASLSDVGDDVRAIGHAVHETGDAIGSIDVPLVGGGITAAGQSVSKAGADVERRGRETHSKITRTAWLVGLAITLLPTLPLLGLYVPLRRRRIRERDAVVRGLDEARGDPAIERMLAERALLTLPYARLVELGEPWRDVAEGRYAELAGIERERAEL
ncbi:MAG: hypothetical protein ACR2K9_07990 [Solirubrobacteraceae bacterium]